MEIHWVHTEEIPDQQRSAAEERIRALQQGHSDLIDLRITARASGHHRHGGQEVRITCQVRGRDIVAARTRADITLALDEALDVFEREVRELRGRRRGSRSERPAELPHLGIVDRIFRDEGYGFVLTDGGEQVYFHRNALHGGLDFERLAEGDRVGLNIEAGDDGPQATALRPPLPDTPSP